MPYCPQCKSEYQTGVERCADCDQTLVEALPPEEPAPLVEIFRAATSTCAERLCTVILDGLECFIRERTSHAFPTPAISGGQLFVAVPGDQADRASQLIREALEDGALTAEDGEPLEPEG